MHSRREATRSQQTKNDPLILLLIILELKLKAAKVYMTDMDITFSKHILYFKVLFHSYISSAHYVFNHVSMIETHVKCDNIYLSVTMYNTQCTAWWGWGWHLIEKKSPRIAECRFEYLKACSSIIFSQQNPKT